MSGESADTLSTRIKNEMLLEQEKYHIKAVEECQCNENIHKNLMYNCIIPCKHTISEDSIININYPKLNHNKFNNIKNIGAFYCSQSSGLMIKALFGAFCVHFFSKISLYKLLLPKPECNQPTIFLVDNHSSRFNSFTI